LACLEYQQYVKSTPILIPFMPLYSVQSTSGWWAKIRQEIATDLLPMD
jgi:hypothetical protein